VSDGEVYMMMQKLGREGKLTCQIVVGEKVVSSDSTTAERDYCGPTWSPVE
jgi:hypothetical protein